MSECIFCQIAAGEAPSDTVYEDQICRAVRDIHPQAPVHLLVMPKVHVESLATAVGDTALLGHLLNVCARVAALEGLGNGYRVATNVGENGCQSVRHLHFHVLGGHKLTETMG